MGIGAIGVPQLLLIALIVGLIFGSRKLRGAGAELGAGVRSIKQALSARAREYNEG